MATVLFENMGHRCVAFSGLVKEDDGIQANQFLIQDAGKSAIIDPGGDLLYTPLWLAMCRYTELSDIRWLLPSHQDPDIIGALGRWLANTPAQLVCSRLWGRFVPHNISALQQSKLGDDRYHLLADTGGTIALGNCVLHALPAHFLHSVGNFSFYDPLSRILFSGDIGSSMVDTETPYAPVTDFQAHTEKMRGFHQRYMASTRVARLWVNMVRDLDPVMIVPQHGLPMDQNTIPQFLEWLANLPCGIDIMDEETFRLPPELGGRKRSGSGVQAF
ncbi:oxygen-binding di-iron domain-containing protein [Luteimonas sp. e5]